MIPDQNDNHLEDQASNQDCDGSRSECSSDNKGDGGLLIKETPFSKRLSYDEIFAMKQKMHGVHAWLQALW